jgi:hypothetical protein
MDAAIQFIMVQGGWGAWFITVCWVIYMFTTGKFVSSREHKDRMEDYKDRLRLEAEEKEFYREALIATSEMGTIITKSRMDIKGRRQKDD